MFLQKPRGAFSPRVYLNALAVCSSCVNHRQLRIGAHRGGFNCLLNAFKRRLKRPSRSVNTGGFRLTLFWTPRTPSFRISSFLPQKFHPVTEICMHLVTSKKRNFWHIERPPPSLKWWHHRYTTPKGVKTNSKSTKGLKYLWGGAQDQVASGTPPMGKEDFFPAIFTKFKASLTFDLRKELWSWTKIPSVPSTEGIPSPAS